SVDGDVLRKTLDARRSLTIGVIATVIGRLNTDQIRDLTSAAEATVPSGADHEADVRSREAVHSFHRKLISLSDNPVTIEVYESWGAPTILARTLWGIDWTGLQRRMSAQYMKLCAALRERQYQEAIDAVDAYSTIALDECLRHLANKARRNL